MSGSKSGERWQNIATVRDIVVSSTSEFDLFHKKNILLGHWNAKKESS